MAKWNDRPSWTEFDKINNGQEFTRILPPEALNALAENIHYLYSYGGGVNSAIPIEVSTEAEMTELLKIGEIGGVYKYTGTTGTYENGALYVLEATDETAPEEPDLSNTFTINGSRYTMENRMTWYEWCKNMDYNTNNFQCASVNDYVYEAETKNAVTDENGDEVIGANYISEGSAYLIKQHTFSFTIVGDDTYTVKDGTTWSKWVNYYAPDRYYIETDTGYVYISHPTKAYIFDSNGNTVKGSYLITEGGVYSAEAE